MIVGFRDGRTANFASGKHVKAFSGIERAATNRLDRLDSADSLEDLAALPGNRFEALKGDRKGSTVFESMINGVFVLPGQRVQAALRMLKLSITTRRLL